MKITPANSRNEWAIGNPIQNGAKSAFLSAVTPQHTRISTTRRPLPRTLLSAQSKHELNLNKVQPAAFSGRAAALKKIQDIRAMRETNPEERIKELSWDPDVNLERPKEGETAFAIENQYGYFERYTRPDPSAPKGDFISLSGDYQGETFDDFGSNIDEGMLTSLKRNRDKTEQQYFCSLEKHLQKADHVVLNIETLKNKEHGLYLKTMDYLHKHDLKHKVIDATDLKCHHNKHSASAS